MKVTIKDIARLAGVSSATVSKILNNNDQHISEKTRRRVLKVIEENNYNPNSVAKGLRMKQSKMIGFVLPDIRNPFFPEIAKGIEDVAKQKGFGVLLCNTDNDFTKEEECFKFLTSYMIDGIIFTRSLKRSNVEKFIKSGVPMVLVDRDLEIEEEVGKIFIDAQKAVYDSTKKLIDYGCKRIAFISAKHISSNERYIGYKEALNSNGLVIDEKLIYLEDYNVETGYRGVNEIISSTSCKVDGVVCGNDLIAVGAIKAFDEKNIQIPNEVKIIGFDDIYLSQYLNPPLTTIHQPAYEFGKEAATMLIDHIENEVPLYTKELEYKLIIRGTV